ncbi:hypothetical protein Y696_00555 [Mesotoga sp. H07pep.5.4]|jgi:formylglycine-generating enzyme required for sulfatase activity|uniref:formylglycine-generating enzyme family protein n=1 Tax=Mesotoga sp. H07pep.5.4 TaxID=1463664 RepID=UPI000FF44961|nr:formylglycine-generating enzyme family protein [Mesotoga sp. H07pep.5.4]RLL82619.1 hypothetical protein Y696_00555 [Mesotoga sp. H07pep.5.4]
MITRELMEKLIRKYVKITIVYSVIIFIMIITNPFWQDGKEFCEWSSGDVFKWFSNEGFTFQCFALNSLPFFPILYFVLSLFLLIPKKASRIVFSFLSLLTTVINVVLIIVVLEFASRAGNNRYGSFYYSEEEGIWGLVNSVISLSATLAIILAIIFTLPVVLVSIASKNKTREIVVAVFITCLCIIALILILTNPFYLVGSRLFRLTPFQNQYFLYAFAIKAQPFFPLAVLALFFINLISNEAYRKLVRITSSITGFLFAASIIILVYLASYRINESGFSRYFNYSYEQTILGFSGMFWSLIVVIMMFTIRRSSFSIQKMVKVEKGSFTTVSSNNEDQKVASEKSSTITFDYDFCIAKYECTFSEYDVFCEITGRKEPNDSGWGRGNRPVIYVSWWDAIAYCNWLSEKEKLTKAYDTNGNLLDKEGRVTTDPSKVVGYRLPTEAEWEYAARGGKKSKGYRYSGSDNVDEVAWYDPNSGGMTQEVGKKAPNELGLYDMSGNVWEWCSDWYGDYSSSAQTNPYNNSGSARVIRGGSWVDNATYARVAYRNNYSPTLTRNSLGFRITRTVP